MLSGKLISKKGHFIIVALLAVGFFMHTIGRQAGTLQDQSETTLLISPPAPLVIQQMIAGPTLGLGAESNLLSVFSIYWTTQKKKLSPEDQQRAWSYLAQYLKQAQSFDPWYWDTYRLTSGLLIYQKDHQQQAFDILTRGAKARAWDWEIPFVVGFLAHDLLKNDELAFRLMKLAIHRPNSPPMVLGLAARFLSKTETVDDSIRFLNALKSTLPVGYSTYIEERIKTLSEEEEP